ncbi:fasciclin domain-containing protein [Pontibacter sp. E15-1]|uniref:fasciclin domain-containing protein n=1 Tax=Pontibacter sp. E15-1 TaxID=2919918 RepID=UPI001F4F747E|nr:fasciclin domain-containing protein [Pontibacter sp. E15-1]MCJ8165937.1 fasciclin domain-containing protein [Pontibacter sp. E15-1]
MSKPAKIILYYLSFLVLLTNCRDKTMDEYYARPDTLADPVYQQLEASGNFKNFVALIEKAGYKNTLSGAGYWTVFAPNDEAFQKFFQENGIASVDAIDEAMASQIVAYALTYNAFTKDRLDDFQSNIGWVENEAFKRRTAFYTGVYTADKITVDGQEMSNQYVIASNRNNATYVSADYNNKHIPFFTDAYFTKKGLSDADYNFFYPNTPRTGFNVAGASVVSANILAENGVIHVIDRVILPLQNMEEYLATKPEYSEFRKLLEKYMVSFFTNTEATRRHQVRTGQGDPVYVKYYSQELPFALNNENYEKMQDNDGQTNGRTLFVPTNNELTQYISSVLLEHYGTVDKLPLNIIRDFVSAHMFPTTVWPTKFKTTSNDFGEEARFDPASNVIDQKVLSNGFFYGTNKVQRANVFHTVYGKAYLNPKYSMMIRALEGDMKFTVTNPAVKFTMFLISDEALTNAGFSWDSQFQYWVYTPPMGGSVLAGGQAQLRMNRIIQQHIAFTFDNQLNDLSGEGIMETFGGEYIKYKDGKVTASGNADNGEMVQATGPVETLNGIVYYLDDILSFTDKKPSQHLAENENFSKFHEYLTYSSFAYDWSTQDIKGMSGGTPYTIFVPSNEAMAQALEDGKLPPLYNKMSTADQEKIAKFIQYHIVGNQNIVTDGQKTGSFPTLHKDLDGVTTSLTVQADPVTQKGKLVDTRVTDANGRTVEVVRANSNVLANKVIIHQIDGYLQHPEN